MHTTPYVTAAEQEALAMVLQRLEPQLREQCDGRDADLFLIRLNRFFGDVYSALHTLYGTRPGFHEYLHTLADSMLEAFIARPDHLRLRDMQRMVNPAWFQHETMLGYTCYVSQLAETLNGVNERLNYLQELGVTYLHLKPLLQTREGAHDGGRAIQDFRLVEPRLGTMDELANLAQELHTRNMSLCVDLVVNHTAQEHSWARRARQGDARYLDYYITFDEGSMLDAYEDMLRDILPESAPGHFTRVTKMPKSSRHVWTTFYPFEWDLNYRNPSVFLEMADVMVMLVNQGVDVLRLDGLPFIWKNVGTECEHQPEVHTLVQAFRGLLRIVAPGVLLAAQTRAPHSSLVSYLGTGPEVGKGCDLADHEQLMVLLWSALAARHVKFLTQTLLHIPPTPTGTTWLTYVRHHDDVEWMFDPTIAQSIGEDYVLHRKFLNEFYRGTFHGSFARGGVFEQNPETGESHRVCGTTASLAGLERALLSGDFYDIGLAIRRILLLYSVIMAYGGIPVICMGDELGLVNNAAYTKEADHRKDSRWLHRPRMDWDKAAQRAHYQTVTANIFKGLRHLAWVRSTTPILRSDGKTQPLWTNNDHVFGLLREHASGRLLLLANFHEQGQCVSVDVLSQAGMSACVRNILDPSDAFTPEGHIYLEPYETMWLVNKTGL